MTGVYFPGRDGRPSQPRPTVSTTEAARMVGVSVAELTGDHRVRWPDVSKSTCWLDVLVDLAERRGDYELAREIEMRRRSMILGN